MAAPIRLTGTVQAVSDPAPGSAKIEIAGTQSSQTRDGWLDLLVEDRTVRVTCMSTACSGAAERITGAFRDLEHKLLAPVKTVPPYTALVIDAVIPAVGDRVEVYGAPTGSRDEESGFRDAPTQLVTSVRALLLARDASLDDAIREAFPGAERPALVDQRATAKSWIGSVVLVALAGVTYALQGVSPIAIALLGCALLARPRLAHPLRAGAAEAPYSAAAYVYFRLFAYAFPGMAFVVSFRLPGMGAIASWFVVAYFAGGIALAAINLRALAPYRRMLAAPPWSGGDADEVQVCGTVADATPTQIENAALARVEKWDRGSIGSRDASVTDTKLHNVGTFTILSSTGDVEVDPGETLWASSVVEKRDGDEADEFILTELVPIGGKVVAVGSITGGALRAKGTAPALVLVTSRDGDPVALARAAIRHDLISLAGVVAVVVLAVIRTLTRA